MEDRIRKWFLQSSNEIGNTTSVPRSDTLSFELIPEALDSEVGNIEFWSRIGWEKSKGAM